MAGLAGCAPGEMELEEPPEAASDTANLINGTVDSAWTQVGRFVQRTSPTTIAYCTGSLIGTRTVLLAAHCVVHGGTTPALDTLYFTVAGRNYGVTRIAVHPAYDAANEPNNDVALLELDEDVRNLRPLPIATTPPVLDETVTLLGYGRTSANTPSDGQRRVGTNQVSQIFSLTFKMTGASGSDAGVCSGDSGGPSLASRNGKMSVVGVHSTASCDKNPIVNGVDGNVSYDARVDAFTDFLFTSAQGNVPGPGALDLVAPTVTIAAAGGTGARASGDGKLWLDVAASDDALLDRLVLFVNGVNTETLYALQPSWSGRFVVPRPEPRADGTVWFQLAAIDSQGRRTNANLTL